MDMDVLKTQDVNGAKNSAIKKEKPNTAADKTSGSGEQASPFQDAKSIKSTSGILLHTVS